MTTAPTNEMLALADELDDVKPHTGFNGAKYRDIGLVQEKTHAAIVSALRLSATTSARDVQEATDEMVIAAHGAKIFLNMTDEGWRKAWRVMRAAAPPLQAPAHSEAVREVDNIIAQAEAVYVAHSEDDSAFRVMKEKLRELIVAALTAPAAKAPAVSEADVGRKLIEAERARQISEEGWSTAHDDTHDDGQLLHAGMCYLSEAHLQHIGETFHSVPPLGWPWDASWWKPSTQERNFVKSGALLLAERDRLQRANRPHSHVDHKIEIAVKSLNKLIQSAAQGGGTEGGEACSATVIGGTEWCGHHVMKSVCPVCSVPTPSDPPSQEASAPEPTKAQVNSACLSYRHDFGMLAPDTQGDLQAQAREWLRAWQKEGFAILSIPGSSRDEVLEQCAVICDDAWSQEDQIFADARNSTVVSDKNKQAIIDRSLARAGLAGSISQAIRAIKSGGAK